MIKLVITDLDDTLYSWIGFFIPAFYDMVQELSLLINVPQEKLLEEYKAIHQEVGSVEYPFATSHLLKRNIVEFLMNKSKLNLTLLFINLILLVKSY